MLKDQNQEQNQKDGSFWIPQRGVVGDMWLGVIGRSDDNEPAGGLLVREVDPANEILRPPVGFERIGVCAADSEGTVWRMIPPPGYVSLGDVFEPGDQEPSDRDIYACVRKTFKGRDMVRRAEIGNMIWSNEGSVSSMSSASTRSGRSSLPATPMTPRSGCWWLRAC